MHLQVWQVDHLDASKVGLEQGWAPLKSSGLGDRLKRMLYKSRRVKII